MRIFEYKGKPGQLPERDWKRLMKRFDLSRAEENGVYYEINQPCICEFYGVNCEGCPFEKLPWGMGCMEIIRDILDKQGMFRALDTQIYWLKEDDKKARSQITKIYKALEGLERKDA